MRPKHRPKHDQHRLLHRANPAAGFSLLELLIVVMILAIWGAIALPRAANSIANQRADAAARRIVRDLALAQQQAKAASESRKVEFTVNTNSYFLPGVRHLDRTGEEYIVSLSDEPYYANLELADFGGDTEIVFDGYGVPSSGGVVAISVGRYLKTITVDTRTGQASIH